MVRKYYYILIFIMLLFVKVNAQISGDVISEIKLIVEPKQDKIMLRWSVTNPLVWKKANQYGYFLERTLISRNGEPVLPLQKNILNNNQPFAPAPLVNWKEPFETDDNAAVIAQALYGESFSTGNLDPVASIMAVNQELEQRFVFALVAAEQSFNAAKLAGWGYEDTDVSPGEKYLYKIWIASPPEELLAKETTVFTGVDLYQPLPVPQKPLAFFEENKADINWDFSSLQTHYTSYDVERSEDDTNFAKVNSYPIFSAEKPKGNKPISLSLADSIPNNKTFYYRIKGRSSFGEVGPPSESVSGIAKETLKFVPQITRKFIVKDDTVVLEWEFDKEANNLISGFELLRSNTDFDGFTPVVKNIAPSLRKLTYSPLKRINYFKIVAKGKNGDNRPSHAAIVQPVDSIPPNKPEGLLGTIDTSGVVKLKWIANTEKDLEGYRVFRSNNGKNEFFEVTKRTVKPIEFTDTIPVKNLNKKIYYKILAEDQRYNASKLSEVLALEKPDLLAPSPTVISKYELKESSMYLKWIPSSSSDVVLQKIYRSKNNTDKWENIVELTTNVVEYTDETIKAGNQYRYVIVAVDASGLESTPTGAVEIEVTEALFQDMIKKFTGVPNRDTRSILLSWKIDKPNVAEIYLYKASDDTSKLSLYKVLSKDVKMLEDKDLQINSIYKYALKVILKNGVESSINTISLNY